MSVTYNAAPQVANIAAKLIAEHHDHLADVTVEFVFRDEHQEKQGHVVMGKARKVSGLNAYLVGKYRAEVSAAAAVDEDFFVIEIPQDVWSVLTSAEREALVDHELSHCRVETKKDGEIKLLIAVPDVADFSAVINRHGLWQPNLREFFQAAKAGQPTLWSELDEDAEGATVTDLVRAG